MKLNWLFILVVITCACSKKGSDSTGQQNSNSHLPRKTTYYPVDAVHPYEILQFNYDSVPNTVVVSSGTGTFLQQEALYRYNTDSFLTGYQCYNLQLFEDLARTIVIKRDQANKITTMITNANGPGYQSDTADFSYKYTGVYAVITVLTHGYLHNFQATDVYRLDTSIYRYIDSSHQLIDIDKRQRDKYLGYTTTNTSFAYKTDGRTDSIVTTIHYNRDYGSNYVGTKTTKWVRTYSYQPGTVVGGARDYFKERLLGKDYYLAPLADLFYYNEKYRRAYQFTDFSLRMAPEPYISRTSPYQVSRIEVLRTSDVVDLYNMPGKQIFTYNYTNGANGRIDSYQCILTTDGKANPQEKVVFEY